MKIAHLLIGFTLFVVFVVTGRFMRVDFPDKEGMDQALRILARSRHIYILFSALIHLVLGIYFQRRQQTAARIVQSGGSALLISASVFLVWAFVTETYSLQHFSDLSRNGIYMSLAGVGLHLLSGLEKR